MIKVKWILPVLMFMSCGIIYGQGFKKQAALPVVAEDAYYKIALPPEILGSLRYDFADIRIMDKEGSEVPYVISREYKQTGNPEFIKYEIYARNTEQRCCSELIIHNSEKKAIDRITFRIKNADTEKKLRISGSNDRENWYIIKKEYYLNNLFDPSKLIFEKELRFPLSDYEFLKFEMGDSLSSPLNILEAGFYVQNLSEAVYADLPDARIIQVDSARKTIIDIQYPSYLYADRVIFNISSDGKYFRNAELMIQGLNGDTSGRYFTVKNFSLRSEIDNVVDLDLLKFRNVRVVIDNRDNPPLKIDQLRFQQILTCLKAEFKKDNAYYLLFDHKEISAPDYDLKYYADKIPGDIELLTPGNIEVLSGQASTEVHVPFFQNPVFIWISLGIVALLLGFMTYRMVADMNKEKKNV
ncbi:MAG: DUF3999 family protein [Cytophagaceae bacterium]